MMRILNHAIFKEVGRMCKEFVIQMCKGMVTVWHTTKPSTPMKEGRMGLYQMFWSFQKRYVIVMQHLLRDPD